MNVNQQNRLQPYRRLDVGRRQTDAAHRPVRDIGQADAPSRPPASLFDPDFERAACGVGFIVNINGQASRKVSIQS